jgi:hypothetical protein
LESGRVKDDICPTFQYLLYSTTDSTLCADSTDTVYLVLWYRELAGKPLYSFDIRSQHRFIIHRQLSLPELEFYNQMPYLVILESRGLR